MKFEVAIVYKGQNNYIIEIPDHQLSDDMEVNKEAAENEAAERFRNGDNGEQTGSEWEEIESNTASIMSELYKPFTVRELAKQFPAMWDYYYKWRNTEEPELEKDINEVLSSYGYKFEKPTESDYNDLKGYLNCPIVRID